MSSTESPPPSADHRLLSDVFEMDMSILAYHLYSQSLIWPLDPFYEQWARPGSSRRNNLLRLTHQFVEGRQSLRGPGFTRGWPGNQKLDPIVYDYQLVRPWSGSVINDGLNHRHICAHRPMMERVSSVSVCEYTSHADGPADPEFSLQRDNPWALQGATDRLYAFEGATGSLDGEPPAWSLMGTVLERHSETSDSYDVHISYRGSQSGDAYRAAFQGFALEVGNPDWVTDMEFLTNVSDPRFSPVGSVVVGLRDAVVASFGSLGHCFAEIADRNPNPPRQIHITGHSLGGALATQLGAALTIGNYSAQLPEAVASWPWRGLQVTSFSAPKSGDSEFAQHFNANVSARRVWAEGDPITEFPFNEHVGTEVALRTDVGGTENHEPEVVRTALVKKVTWELPDVAEPRLGHEPWRYFDGLGLALAAAEDHGDSLAELFPTLVGDSQKALVELAAATVQLRSSYRVPFTKFPGELRRRARQLRWAFSKKRDSVAEVAKHLRRFRGIQPGSAVEDYLRQLFVLSEAVRNGWSAAELLDNEAVARVLGTYRHPRSTAGDSALAVAGAVGPQPSARDESRVKWILRMRRLHLATVNDGPESSFRQRVPPVSGMPHLVPACSHYEGLDWLPQQLMVPTKLPAEAQLLSKYKALYYGLGKLGFAAYKYSPINPKVPWRASYDWNSAFPPTGDGWTHPTSDETFVRLRLQGPNPFMLQRSETGFELDFSQILDGVMPPVCARFDLEPHGLVPRDISIGPFTHRPGDASWENAKRVVNAADIRCVPFARHLLDVHFIVGSAFALAAYNLPTWHPLRPFMHFFSYGTLQVNDFAYQAFFVPTSYFIASGFVTGDFAHAMFQNRIKAFSFDDWVPPRDIAARGIDEIPNHPYVEDSLSIWAEFVAIVTRYLDELHYDEAAIASDNHLQAWYLTLADLIPNTDPHASPLTRDRLIELCAGFLYNNVIHEICGDLSPILGSTDPDDKAIINLQNLADAVGNGRLDTPLPAPTMADVFLMDQATHASQFNVGGNNLLKITAARYVDDPKLTVAVSDLQRSLKRLEVELTERNNRRSVRFNRMLPSRWEASISF